MHFTISTGHSGDCVRVVRSEGGEDGEKGEGGSQVLSSVLQFTRGCRHSAQRRN